MLKRWAIIVGGVLYGHEFDEKKARIRANNIAEHCIKGGFYECVC